MKFGGHETFFLRPGWLTKGLHLVRATDDTNWASDAASDAMGVGRNMSKSIGWWLSRTGIVMRAERSGPITLTPFGEALLKHDPHLVQMTTWWVLHFKMCLNGRGDVFSWFFTRRGEPRFTRAALEGALHAEIERSGEKMPAAKTLNRDIAVLLQSYSRPLPISAKVDPEDNLDCPLRRLDLIVHRTDLDVYERRSALSVISPEAICFGLLSTQDDLHSEFAEVSFDNMGALRTLSVATGRSIDAVADIVSKAAETLDDDLLTIRQLGGQRVARVRNHPAENWLRLHYERATSALKA